MSRAAACGSGSAVIRRLQPDKGAAAPSSVKRTVAASPHREASREELEARQRHVEKHLLRVQQERFEAQHRGESTEHLSREFQHAQEKRRAVIQELAR